MKKPARKLSKLSTSLLVLGLLILAHNAWATVYYWDPEGTSTAATNNLTGTWTTSASQWSSTSSQTASPTTWPQSAAACFCAGSTTVSGSFAVSVNSSNIIIGGIYNGPLNPPGYNVVINGTGALILSNAVCAFDTGGSDGDPTTINCILAGTGPIQQQGTKGLFLNGANTFTGGFEIGGSGGISFGNNAAFGTGTITWQTGGFIQPTDTAAYNIPNAMTHIANTIETYSANTAGVTFSGPWAIGSSGYVELENIAGAITVSGPISGSANLTFTNKTGTTATWALTGVNTFSGALTNGLGNLTIGGAGQLGSGTFAGNMMNRGNFIYNSSANQNLSGVISGSGTITSAGAGTLTLSGANTYTGVTTNSGGILNLNHSETVNSSGPLGKQSDTVAGTLVMSGGILQYSANNSHDYSGRMSTAANQQYNIDVNSRGITYASALVSSGGQLTLSDSGSGGVLTLNGINTYTGNTTVKSGTLKLGATGSILQTPQISLASGATLDVSASGITLTGSGPAQTLVASSSSGTATINATGKTVTLNSGALLSFVANGASSTVGQISVSGSSANLTLNNNTISVNISGGALGVGTYRLASCAGTLTGAAYSVPTITGSGIAAGCIATIVTTDGASGHVDLAVNSTGPTITTQPSSQTACYGQNAVFTVTGSGNGDSYYWLQHSNAGWGNTWTVGSTGGGTFLGTSTDNNNGNPNCSSFGSFGDINTSSGNSWGLYSTDGSGEAVSRDFPSALTNGQVFQIDMDNGFIDNGVQCGFSLHSGSSFLFSFYFQGGATDYSFSDSTGNHTTSVGYTQNGLRVTVVVGPGSPATYNLLVQACGGPVSTYSGTFAAAGSPSAVNLFDNNSTGGDNYNLYFNNLYAGGAYDNADNYTNNWAGSDGGDIAIPGENNSTFITNRTGGVGVYALAYNNAGVVGSSSATLSNTPKALGITGLTVMNKVYDDTTGAVLNGTVSLGATETFGSGTCGDGLPFAGDSVSLTGTPVGAYNSKDVSTATNVTITGLSLTGADAANYVLTNNLSYPAAITPKPLSVAGTLSAPASKTYDGTTLASVGGAAALLNAETVGTGSTSDGAPYSGDSVSLSGSVTTAAYNSKDVSSANLVTFNTSGLSLTGTDGDDYSVSVPIAQAAAITALSVSLTGTRPYDGSTTAAAGILAVANLAVGDSVTVASGGGTLASPNLGVEAISSFGTLALGNNSAGDYTLSGASGSVNITQAALTITANNQSKTYGQTATFGSGSTNFTSIGLQNGDTIGSVTLAVSGNGDASNAPVSGSPYTITPSAATGGTFTPANYSISYYGGQLAVGPASLTVAADSLSRPYGATNPVLTVTYTNFVNGETLGTSDVTGSPVLTISADTNSDVGAYVVTNAVGTLTSSDYSFSLVNGTLTVTNALSTNVVTASTNPALPGTAVAFSANLSTIAPSMAVPTNVVQFLIDGINYGSAYPSNGVASITNASLSHGYHIVEADYDGDTNALGETNIVGSTNTLSELINTPPVAGPATYSRPANSALNINVSDLLTNATDADGDTITLVSVSSISTNGASIVVSNGVITYMPPATNGNVTDVFSYTVEDSYDATNTGSVTIVVTQFQPAFSGLSGQTIIYGASPVALSGTISAPGPVYPAMGESVTVTINGNAQATTINDSTGDFSINYGLPALPVSGSPYPITYSYAGDSSLSAASDSNTALTVGPAPLMVTAGSQSKTYGQTLTFGSGSTNFTSSGLQNGETIGSVTLAVSGNGGASNAPVSGSPYTISASAAVGGTFNPANYSISYNSGLLTVGPASLAVTADNLSRPYGATNPVFTVTYTNFVNGETLGTSDVQGAPALVTAANTNSDVDDYIITNTIGTLTSSNYTFSLVNGVLTVTNALSTNVVAASANPALPGTAVVFSATLSTIAPSMAVPTNLVQFLIDGISYGSAVYPSNGVASITNASLSHGYHLIEADYDGDTNAVGATNIIGSTNTLTELINTPPVAGPATYSRLAGMALNIPISNLLNNATDADGDAITFVSVSPLSTNGASIVTSNGVITYLPPATNGNVTDVFSYTVEDTYDATNTGLVTVTVLSEASGPPVNITGVTTQADGSVQLNFSGGPNYYYLIEATTNLGAPITWTVLSTNQADTNGLFQFTDTTATNYPTRYYRTAVPPGD